MSAGRGATNSRGWPVRGWVRRKVWAWRAWRSMRTGVGVGAVGAEEVAEGQAVAAGIGFVGDDRMADVGEVDADLMGPAGSGLAADEGEAAKPLDDLVEGDGFLAAVLGQTDRHLFAVGGVRSRSVCSM